ncbi:HD-GYP domain-containing protein [Halobacillus yeomjeoni]|uniref:HD-GYP domain-containing protein n=1 Tax=Halobacillus yeomjeoni TaxID=311194 RepID=A0A931HXT0_9BACI|nr:HD-GYP domain-containing protein [Halobacillus yeomjeoni]MBH0231665.1 HD-GYP domain-containing protein [Halobacillus yeomjeoni]
MKPFDHFQRRIVINYIVGSMTAVFGVGSVFIFHTLSLSSEEVIYLLGTMVLSVLIMLVAEWNMYQIHIRPIKRIFKSETLRVWEYEEGMLAAHRFPLLTVYRILGPHLFGLAVPASLLTVLGIFQGWINVPYYYIGLAWTGAVLIAIMHALIEFFLTYRASNNLISSINHKLQNEGHEEVKVDFKISLKHKLLVSSVFTAVFPVLLFILASQIRFMESGGGMVEQYWSWASLVIIVILAMAVLSSSLLFKSIEEPMGSLRMRFDQVRTGEFTKMENVYTDEFSNLVTGFNHMVSSIQTRDEENERLLESFFKVFAATLDARDPYTAGHSERVAEYSVQIAERAGFADKEIDLIRKSALLHDIGKIGVPDRVLLKEGRLTDEEFIQIKKHPEIGADILKQVQLPDELKPVLSGVRHHHERFDGKGYPDGLCGEETPVFGRLMAVADAFDAMTSNRPYREGMPVEKAIAIIESGKGTQWDPYFVDLFLEEIEGQEIKPSAQAKALT